MKMPKIPNPMNILRGKKEKGKEARPPAKSAEDLAPMRHTLAHLLAAAVMELYPDTKRTIGPAIDNGFYYDFEFSKPLTDADLPKIEVKMREILPSWTSFERSELGAEEAKREYPGNPYKHELIEEFTKEGQKVSFYKSGNYSDLCRGGHVQNPASEIDPSSFQLSRVAGAYWRGDEKNKMLTRIYGRAFSSKEELDHYINMQEEAKKRDHKVLGTQLELLMFHETSPGMPYWLPKGMIIINELINFWRKEHKERGYLEIASPLINKKELWITSGHWDHYKDDMFIANMGEDEVYGIKPMNCPNAMIVFGSRTRSYRDLPYRLSDTDILHRYERSGVLNGLLRARSFRQDDSHNFIAEDMIEAECSRILDLTERFYGIFGLQYFLKLSTRPDQFLGDIATWDKAEAALRKVLIEKVGAGKYGIKEKDGAFYGPKIDIHMTDALGREWQMGTIQLDFQQPQRFKLEYADKDGSRKTPVVIHRVLYGSIERFLGILIEHTAGAFPFWLSPVQVKVLPITDTQKKYAEGVYEKLLGAGIRAEIDTRTESLGKKIRDAKVEKVPYFLVIGEKEQKEKKVTLESRPSTSLGTGDKGEAELLSITDLLAKFEKENRA